MFVYWIHTKEHTNMAVEGYIGITIDIDRRKKEHFSNRLHNRILTEAFNTYDLLIDVVFEGTDIECINLEKELRPHTFIGWNIAKGGGIPPDCTGRKDSAYTRYLKSINNVGFTGREHSEYSKNKMSVTSLKKFKAYTVYTPKGAFSSLREAASACSLSKSGLRYRIDNDNCIEYYKVINDEK